MAQHDTPRDVDEYEISTVDGWETRTYTCACGARIIPDDSVMYADGNGDNYCRTD